MTLEEYIRENRAKIDAVIEAACGPNGRFDDEERRLWVLNDEVLYNDALEHGVDFS